MKQWMLFAGALLVALFSTQATAAAEDAFYGITIKDLKLTEGKLPASVPGEWLGRGGLAPHVVLDGKDAGEAYISYVYGDVVIDGRTIDRAQIVFRVPVGKDITGRLSVPGADGKSLTAVRFSLPAARATVIDRGAFFLAKRRYFEALVRGGIPGGAWFRHQAKEASIAGGENPAWNLALGTPQTPDDSDATYSLFTGGRAVSENLQLYRVLVPRAARGDAIVPIESLPGITVKEMDWKPLIGGKHPQTDRLAALIPMDQHAIFFPTMSAALTLVDEVDRQGTPVLQYAEPRSEDARTRARYERQMCLPLTGIGRLLGPTVINSVAVTGSDLYLRVGSDVAVLLEPKDSAAVLNGVLSAQMKMAADADSAAHAAPVNGNVGGIAYTGHVSPDRRICAYLATVGNAVVVTNSLAQLQRLADVNAGKFKAVDSTPEYVFFRDRYPRGEGEESALVVLTDATIRRWCSPKWRIADSRRTRAAAVMAEVQASYLDKLATGKVESGPVHGEHGDTEAGEMRLTPAGATSSLYGNLEFMTPIAEMDLAKATQAEAAIYGRWRDTYQQNWSNYFDPIAVRFSASADRLAADLTVMPLIAGSNYQEMIKITEGAKLLPEAGDPHSALLHLALAINIKSDAFKSLGGSASSLLPQLKVEPLSWVGQTAALYVDDDPIWDEAAKAQWSWDFIANHFTELPVALYVQSSSVLKLTAFLTGVRTYIDQSAPGMTVWEPQKYNDQFYVKVGPSKQAKADSKEIENAAVYYTTAGGALLITPNEALLKRALDRQTARAAATTQPATLPATQPAASIPAWVGDNFGAQLNIARIGALQGLFRWKFEGAMQQQAWDNLPILNEWKRRFPDQDPVKLHEKLWQVRLVDPAGGSYAWNDKFQTMESTTYGCPESPKAGPSLPPALNDLRRANLGSASRTKACAPAPNSRATAGDAGRSATALQIRGNLSSRGRGSLALDSDRCPKMRGGVTCGRMHFAVAAGAQASGVDGRGIVLITRLLPRLGLGIAEQRLGVGVPGRARGAGGAHRPLGVGRR